MVDTDPFTRWEVGVGDQGDISPEYDPMLAKLVVRGQSREECFARATMVLRGTLLFNSGNNLDFLANLLTSKKLLDQNFILDHSLRGGGSCTLQADAQGKTYSQALLRQKVHFDDDILTKSQSGLTQLGV